jgi:hypothetical protein
MSRGQVSAWPRRSPHQATTARGTRPTDAVKLSGLVGTAGDEAAVGREIVKPTFGNGNGYGYGYGTKRAEPVVLASEKQVAFLTRLAAERETPTRSQVLIAKGCQDLLSKKETSVLIDLVLGCPKIQVSDRNAKVQAADAKRRAESVVLEAGIYLLDGAVYKVQQAVHGSGQMYAKVLTTPEYASARFEYVAGAISKIRPEHKMSLEQAVEFGAVYGVCCRCGRTLTDENSEAVPVSAETVGRPAIDSLSTSPTRAA